MTKFISTPGSAYETAPGVTADEAREAGLAIVEYAYGTNPPAPIYGRYKDAPDGHPLGVTVATPGDTKVIGTGAVGAAPAPIDGGKGSLLNRNDPVIHGGTGDESVHADNAPPLVDNAAEQERLLREGAVDPLNPEPAPKSKK